MSDTLQGGTRAGSGRARYAPVARISATAPWAPDTSAARADDELDFPDGFPWSPAPRARTGTPIAVPVLVLTDAAPAAAPTAGRRRARTVGVRVTAALLVLTALGLAAVASHEHRAAGQWRQLETRTFGQLEGARAVDRTTAAQVVALEGQVATLDSQLAAQASAKEQAIDRSTVLSQWVAEEQVVASELDTCRTDLQSVLSTVGADLADGVATGPAFEAVGRGVGRLCARPIRRRTSPVDPRRCRWMTGRWGAAPVAALALALGACTASPPAVVTAPVRPTGPTTTVPVATRLWDEARRITLRVRNAGCDVTGSSFTTTDGVVTDRHVAGGTTTLQLSTWAGDDLTAMVLALSPTTGPDLAVAGGAVGLPSPPAALAGSDPPTGSPVWAAGYPLGHELTLTPGTVTGYVDGAAYGTSGRVMELSAAVHRRRPRPPGRASASAARRCRRSPRSPGWTCAAPRPTARATACAANSGSSRRCCRRRAPGAPRSRCATCSPSCRPASGS